MSDEFDTPVYFVKSSQFSIVLPLIPLPFVGCAQLPTYNLLCAATESG